MKYLKLFEQFELIKESLELASLAKKLVLALKKDGLQVGLQYSNEKTESGIQRWDGKQITFTNGKRQDSEKSTGRNDDVTIYCDIRKDKEEWSQIGITFRYIPNYQAAKFVGNFIKSLENFMKNPQTDKTGKPLDKPLSDVLTIQCPFGWKLGEIETKIGEIIEKQGYFSTLQRIIVIKPKITPKKSERELKQDASKVLGLKKGEVESNGKYDLYGSAFLFTGKDEDKKREVALLAANEKTKKVSISNYLNYEKGQNDKIIQLAKNYAKKMNFTYVDSQYQINK